MEAVTKRASTRSRVRRRRDELESSPTWWTAGEGRLRSGKRAIAAQKQQRRAKEGQRQRMQGEGEREKERERGGAAGAARELGGEEGAAMAGRGYSEESSCGNVKDTAEKVIGGRRASERGSGGRGREGGSSRVSPSRASP